MDEVTKFDLVLEKIKHIKSDTCEIKADFKKLNGVVRDHDVQLGKVRTNKFYWWMITTLTTFFVAVISSLLTAIYFFQR